jgi:hypothetical protein
MVIGHTSAKVISGGSHETVREFYTKDEAARLPIQAIFIGFYANKAGLGCSL